MYCRNCGKPITENATVCIGCGVPVNIGRKFCNHCAAATDIEAVLCIRCGCSLAKASLAGEKSQLTAGLLGILLGFIGVHRFYLGFVGIGIAQIAVTLFTGIGAIWGFIEGILILTGNINKDAKGLPLRE